MDRAAQKAFFKTLKERGIAVADSQDNEAIPAPCPHCEDERKTARLDIEAGRYSCVNCPGEGRLVDYTAQFESNVVPLFSDTSEQGGASESGLGIQDAEYHELEPNIQTAAVVPFVLSEPYVVPPEAEKGPASSPPIADTTRRPGNWIIRALSILFLLAGLGAAILSGFANYTAFAATVSDPLQSRIWGGAGIIASVISLGGFTFFWWHLSGGRWGEASRSLLFALAAAATSILGTKLFIDNNNSLQANAATLAMNNRAVLESQIEDWRGQLVAIPSDTRSVEGLEAYLAGVEQVGRTHQKPYRDAQNELGLAKRRDALLIKVEEANAELLGIGENNISVSANERPALPAWFFAIMLELFSSQATSIAAVALLILGRRSAH